MAAAEHYDALARYGATAVRLVPALGGEPSDFVTVGGGLARAVEEVGPRIAVEVLRDPAWSELLLADGVLEVEARRTASRVQWRVRWGTTVVADETLDLAPVPVAPHVAFAAPTAPGAAAFRARWGVQHAAVGGRWRLGLPPASVRNDPAVFPVTPDTATARALLASPTVQGLVLPAELSLPTLALKLRKVREVASGREPRPFLGVSMAVPSGDVAFALFALGFDFIVLPSEVDVDALFQDIAASSAALASRST